MYKVTDIEFDDTLCSNNMWVQHKIRQLRKSAKNAEDKQLLNECLDLLRFMKIQGQKMENRLRLYRLATEKLGFERIKKKRRT